MNSPLTSDRSDVLCLVGGLGSEGVWWVCLVLRVSGGVPLVLRVSGGECLVLGPDVVWWGAFGPVF